MPCSGPIPASGRTLLTIVHALSATDRPPPMTVREPLSHGLVGRDAELRQLEAWMGEVEGGAGRCVLISGRSGMGKTSLLEAFLGRTGERAKVLRGRCYERERIPYKSIDSLVEHVVRDLGAVDDATLRQLLSDEDAVLSGVFPVFAPLFGRLELSRGGGLRFDTGFGELRRLAFAALRRVFARLSATRPLLVFIDDIQWGDLDSLLFLEDLIRDVKVRALTVIGFREEERERSEVLQKLLADLEGSDRVSAVHVGELARANLEALARALLPDVHLAEEVVARIAQECNGSPYFLQELVRYVATKGQDAASAGLTLDGVIRERVRSLPDHARSMLETICVAGAPLTQHDIQRATGVTEGATSAMHQLLAGQLVRTYGAEQSADVEAFHDRVRESVLGGMDPKAVQGRHFAIAKTLDAGDVATTEADRLYLLADHYFYAGEMAPGPKTFELCYRAARTAVSAQAYATADEYLRRASLAAERGGVEVSADFFEMRAEIGLRRGRATDVEIYGARALEHTDVPTQRARIYFLLLQLHLGLLATREAYAYAVLALESLGLPKPKRGIAPVLIRGLGAGTRLLLGTRGPDPSPEERSRGLLKCRILSILGLVMYFELERVRPLELALEAHQILIPLGDTPELAAWFCLIATFAAIIKRRNWAMGLLDRARNVAERLRDPESIARVHMHRGFVLHFLGDVVAAERELAECFEHHGDYLRLYDYVLAGGAQAWNLMMRGKTKEAWEMLERTYRRARADAESDMSASLVHHVYAGSVLAMLGRAEESDEHLAVFQRAHFASGRAPSLWAQGQYWAHRTMQLVELGRLGDELDEALGEIRSLGMSPKGTPEQMRHAIVAESYARLRQAEEDPSHSRLRTLRQALSRLEKGDTHPTLHAHRLVMAAGEARLRGRRARALKLVAAARATAAATDNAWVEHEALLTLHRLGEGASDGSLLDRAVALAREHGWALREKRAERLRSGGR